MSKAIVFTAIFSIPMLSFCSGGNSSFIYNSNVIGKIQKENQYGVLFINGCGSLMSALNNNGGNIDAVQPIQVDGCFQSLVTDFFQKKECPNLGQITKNAVGTALFYVDKYGEKNNKPSYRKVEIVKKCSF